MRRGTLFFCLVALSVIGLWGCGDNGRKEKKQAAVEEGQEQTPYDISVIEVKKDGEVTGVIQGTFEREYYTQEELKNFILSEVADYNGGKEKEAVRLKKLTVKKNEAKIVLQFATAQDYGEFNRHAFFYGTVSEADLKGYDLERDFYVPDVTEKKAEEEGAFRIDREELLSVGSRKLIILEKPEKERLTVKISGTVLYTAGPTVCHGKKTVEITGSEPAYIVFK